MTTLVLDLETKRLASEVGGWSHIDKLGLAAAVLYHIEQEEYTHYTEDRCPILLDYLVQADEIIGFNLLRFDYLVLQPYGLPIDKSMIGKTADIMVHVQNTLGFRLRLDNLVNATLGEKKSADGLKSVEWYKAGDLEKVLKYCQQDVRVTYLLWDYGKVHGKVSYFDRGGIKRDIQVQW